MRSLLRHFMMHRRAALHRCTWTAASLVSIASGTIVGCGAESSESSGALQLVVALGERVDAVHYTIVGPTDFSQTGKLDVSNDDVVRRLVAGVPPGGGYSVTATAVSTEGWTGICAASSAPFYVLPGTTTVVPLPMPCVRTRGKDSVLIQSSGNQCPSIDSFLVAPAKVGENETMSLTSMATDVDKAPSPLMYSWSATSGTVAGASSQSATFTCTSVGRPVITLKVSDGDPRPSCADEASFSVICVACIGEGTACDDHNTCTQIDTCHAESCIGSNPARAGTPCAPGKTCNANGACVDCPPFDDCPGRP